MSSVIAALGSSIGSTAENQIFGLDPKQKYDTPYTEPGDRWVSSFLPPSLVCSPLRAPVSSLPWESFEVLSPESQEEEEEEEGEDVKP